MKRLLKEPFIWLVLLASGIAYAQEKKEEKAPRYDAQIAVIMGELNMIKRRLDRIEKFCNVPKPKWWLTIEEQDKEEQCKDDQEPEQRKGRCGGMAGENQEEGDCR